MRKSALFLAALIAVSMPSLAHAAKKGKKMKSSAMAAQTDPNANSRKFLRDGLRQIVVPFKTLAGTADAPAKKGKKSKKKKM